VGVHQVKEFAPRFSLGCSVSSLPYVALALMHHPRPMAELKASLPYLAVYYAMTRGGVGSIRSLPFFRDPLVRYRLTSDDRLVIAEALRELCRCLLSAGALEIYPSFSEAPVIRNAKDLERLPRTFASGKADLMTIHLFSSCPMGEARERTAVDSFGRVHGTKGLMVADGSLLCTAPGVNPQGSIMALARRNAMRFLGK
jgi:choline dehydrogenase-like flavoprotein